MAHGFPTGRRPEPRTGDLLLPNSPSTGAKRSITPPPSTYRPQHARSPFPMKLFVIAALIMLIVLYVSIRNRRR